MSSSSSNSRTSINNSRRLDARFEHVYCRCGISAPCWEAWRIGTQDPGRRFFGCSRYKDPKSTCNFFQWADPPFTERGREVVYELKTRLDVKTEELQKMTGEYNFTERKVVLLNEELMSSKKKNEEYEVTLLKMEKTIYRLKKLFIALLVFSVFVMFL